MISFHRLISIFMSRTHLTSCKLKRENAFNVFKIMHHKTNFSSKVRGKQSAGLTFFVLDEHYNVCNPQAVSRRVRMVSNESKAPVDDIQKAVEDEEFKNLLKDFAKDFGVSGESEKILDDIRKNNEYPQEKDPATDVDASDRTTETLSVYHSLAKERFKEFDDQDSNIIYSYEEEQSVEEEDFFHIDQEYESHITEREVKRGITGVYDIEELIPILRQERLFDISVIQIPEHCHYADYLVLCTAKSIRHLKAVTEFVYKFYKMKKDTKDPFVKIEGEKLGTWKAMDMGNIVLHVFLEDTRALYDIESLWLLDTQYDSGGAAEDNVADAMQAEIEFLNYLKTQGTLEKDQEIPK